MTDVKIPMSCAPLKPILEKEGNLNYNGINFFAPVSIIVRDKFSKTPVVLSTEQC